jgi:membrane protease subunit HflK
MLNEGYITAQQIWSTYMAWNQPGNNGQDRDPWGSSKPGGDSGGNSGGNKGGREQGPPDLDDIFRKLSKKLGGFGGGNKGGGTGQGPRGHMGGKVVGIVAVAAVIIWAASGFYTIKEAERGVVTRFGKFSHLVEPGLNWKPTFIDNVRAVNVESVRELAASGVMLTSDENVVRVEMNVQYRVTDPEQYLYAVTSADDSLRQATDSALRGVIGKYTMDRILTEGRTVIRSDTQRELEETIKPYNMGITLLDVNFQAARPPEEVKSAFDDAIAARENEQQYIREAEAYANEVQPRANGRAQRILEEARAYKTQTVLEAQGEVSRFAKILPEYKAAPEITRERLYIETMEKVLSHTRKVLVNDKGGGNLMVLPLDQMLKGGAKAAPAGNSDSSNLLRLPPAPESSSSASQSSSSSNGDIMDQRRANAQRNDTQRRGGE